MNTSDSVRSLILERIEMQTYKPGDRIDTFRQLAADANTSPPTVSRAINRLVQDGYLCADPNRGYCVRETPGGGAVRGTTGLLLGVQQDAKLGSEFAGKRYRDILPILQEGSIRLNRAMLTLGGLVGEGFCPVDLIAERRLEALLVLGLYDNRYLAELSAVQTGVIALDLDATDLGIDSISFDHIGSAISMIQHLAKSGKKRIGYLGGQLAPRLPAPQKSHYDSCARERFDGFLAGMRAYGLPVEERIVRSTQNVVTDHILHDFATMDNPPEALIMEQPRDGVLFYKGEKAACPSEIALAGWMSVDHFAHEGPEMTVAAVNDFALLGDAILEVLQFRLEHPNGPVQRRKVFPKLLGSDGTAI